MNKVLKGLDSSITVMFTVISINFVTYSEMNSAVSRRYLLKTHIFFSILAVEELFYSFPINRSNFVLMDTRICTFFTFKGKMQVY